MYLLVSMAHADDGQCLPFEEEPTVAFGETCAGEPDGTLVFNAPGSSGTVAYRFVFTLQNGWSQFQWTEGPFEAPAGARVVWDVQVQDGYPLLVGVPAYLFASVELLHEGVPVAWYGAGPAPW